MNQKKETTQYQTILTRLRELMAQAMPASLSGEMNLDVPFLEMGANSLMLMDVQRTVESEYGITITIAQFFEELTTIGALVGYIDEQLTKKAGVVSPVSVVTTPLIIGSTAAPVTSNAANVALPVATSELEAIFASQIRITAQAMNDLVARQLQFLARVEVTASVAQVTGQTTTAPAPVSTVNPAPEPASPRKKGALQPQKMLSALETRARGLTPVQQQHLEALIRDYNARTPKSKAYADRYRPVLADSRAAVGFRFTTKEMLYLIVAGRARGSRIWDIDGNEYIDITMGQGVTLFGHHPEFIATALRKMGPDGVGVGLGPRPESVGEVAELLCELTGFDRVTFTNSGTEAVMAALRLARAVTGRNKIVMFEGAYHGHADSVMGMAVTRDGELVTQPVSPGTPPGAVADLLVLPYDETRSLEIIKKHGSTIAAVIVEPVQSRNPRVQPREFLHALRQLTTDIGALLIFDEMITGFRSHPGGAQAWFGVHADIATYGKVIGGGMPIGVVAGKARLMDPIDGGAWRYGDNSYPEVNRVVFGGTFCQHPLAMTAALATLRHLKTHAPELQNDLNRRTTALATELNRWFADEQVPIEVVWFGSLFRFEFSSNLELLFYHMNLRGIFVWEWRNCFLSTAHTEADIAAIITAVKDSVLAMRAGGFIPPKGNGDENNAAVTLNTYSLNTAQRQLAALAQITPEGSKAYHLSTLLELQGTVDERVLAQAVDSVVARHEAPRSVIDGEQQRVAPPAAGLLRCVDLRGQADVETACRDWLAAHIQQTFDLANGPLLVAHLVRLADTDYRLVLKGHHIIIDGLSMNLVVNEIAHCYGALRAGSQPTLPNPLQYRDYLRWQAGNTFAEAERYWLEQLNGELPRMELPADRPSPALKSYSGGRVTRLIDRALFAGIRKLSSTNGATPFMTLFALHGLWLHRLTDQDDLIIGMPVAGRSLAGGERLVGYCTHLLPIRSRINWNEPFTDYLKRIRGVLLQGYQHQDYPFARLMERLKVPRDGRQAPLVTVIFNLDRPGTAPAFGDLRVRWLSLPIHHTAFELVMNLTELGDDLALECDYNGDRFDVATIERMIDHFQTLMAGVVAQPQRSSAKQPLLDTATWRSWLLDWNHTDHPYRADQGVAERFAIQAAATPEAIALRWPTGELDYRTLNRTANQLAHYLRAQGVTNNRMVAIYLRRSPSLVVAILATLKAGGAYLPLDPDYPAARLAFMLEDARPQVLLTEISLVGNLPPVPGMTQRLLDDEGQQRDYDQYPPSNPDMVGSADDLAYVIYTSGSTGQPKGTMICRRGLINYLNWAMEYYRTREGSGSPLHSSIGFDATITSLFTPLLSGRTLRLLPHDGEEIEHISAALQGDDGKGHDWSLVKLTPAHLDLLNVMIQREQLAGLTRYLVLGGEALLGRTVTPWRQWAPDTHIINEYGPTETVVGCAIYDDRRSAPLDGEVPIGRPIWNTRLYVLDQRRQPMPVGVPGELYIGGDGIALGYLNRPELTVERFIDIGATGLVEGPESPPPGKLYRTGDRVRLQADGELVYLGRYDNQIKLRGYRIELDEIQNALIAQPGIREAVVVVTGQGDHDQRLAAYLVADDGVALQISVLRAKLGARLPDHMIPAHFVVLDKLPLTSNGKIDRQALPALADATRGGSPLLSPRNDVERRLVAIWRELLQRDAVGIDDNFFEIGGHSLMVLPLRERLLSEFSYPLSPVDLFRYPTVATLAQFLSASSMNNEATPTTTGSTATVPSGRKRRDTAARRQILGI
ncbi:glutamate-1-semialdehyde 2,1-aminomutase [Gammaproteobacteria bacterium]